MQTGAETTTVTEEMGMPSTDTSSIPDRFEIVADTETLAQGWMPTNIGLIPALSVGEVCVDGETVLNRLPPFLAHGARKFEFFWIHQNEIPHDWRNHVVSFDATVFIGPSGRRCTLTMDYGNGHWRRGYQDLGFMRTIRYATAVDIGDFA